MDPPTPQQRRPTAQPSTPTADETVKPLDVSFGVEFEFILVEHFPDFAEWNAKTRSEKVFYGLSQAGDVLKNTRFRCKSCGKQFRMPINVQTDNKDWESDHSQWNIVADASMELTTSQKRPLYGNNFDMMGIEVTSRKLFADRDQPVPSNGATTDHKHTISAADEIETVLGALRQAFNSPASANDIHKARWLVVNKTCDLHVHVGNDEKGFPLQTVKNLLSLCTAFERVIDGMHPYTRTGGTRLALAALDKLDDSSDKGTGTLAGGDATRAAPIITERRVHNVPLTEHFIARAYCQRRNAAFDLPPPSPTAYPYTDTPSNPRLARAVTGLHTAAFLDVIQGAPYEYGPDGELDLDPLGFLVQGNDTTVSPMYLLKGWYTRAKTIEFRQHAAVVTPAETLPWIDFVTALVKFADTSSADAIHNFCIHAAVTPTLSLMELLVLLPMNPAHMNYYVDRAVGSTHFYDDVTARAEVQAAFGNVAGPLRTIALELIDEEKAGYDIGSVRKGVRNKFDAGGYGQFSRMFIDAYAPDLDDEVKEKLTIGWEAPVHGSEDEDEDELPEWPAIPGVEDIPTIQD
jgi:hypothetical protein